MEFAPFKYGNIQITNSDELVQYMEQASESKSSASADTLLACIKATNPSNYVLLLGYYMGEVSLTAYERLKDHWSVEDIQHPYLRVIHTKLCVNAIVSVSRVAGEHKALKDFANCGVAKLID